MSQLSETSSPLEGPQYTVQVRVLLMETKLDMSLCTCRYVFMYMYVRGHAFPKLADNVTMQGIVETAILYAMVF